MRQPLRLSRSKQGKNQATSSGVVEYLKFAYSMNSSYRFAPRQCASGSTAQHCSFACRTKSFASR